MRRDTDANFTAAKPGDLMWRVAKRTGVGNVVLEQTPIPELGPHFREDRPLVYVTIGSSGRYAALSGVLQVIGELPVNAVLATAGRFERLDTPPGPYRAPPSLYDTVVAPPSSVSNPAYQPVSRGRRPYPGGQCRKQTPSPDIAYLYPPAT